MHVLHVTAYYAPAFVYGGPPRSIHGLCRALRETGVDVHVYTTDANGDGTLPADITGAGAYDGVPVRYFARTWPASPLGSRPLAAALCHALRTADLVHIHGLWNRVVWAAAREARRAGVPYVLSPRGMLEGAALTHRSMRKRVAWTLVERATIEGAALLHATSERERDTLRALCPGAEVALVPNGVDVPRSPNRGTREPLIAFIGRLHPIKRLDLLVDAFTALHATRSSARLVIAGPDEAGLREGLMARAGHAASAIAWHGAVDAEEKAALLARASALVMCSDSESFGLSAAEAMAAATPVVVTRTCPWTDVERHQAGFWVEQHPVAIADALRTLVDNPDAARAMGARGRALIEQKYQWPAVAADMAAQYARLLDSPSPCRAEAYAKADRAEALAKADRADAAPKAARAETHANAGRPARVHDGGVRAIVFTPQIGGADGVSEMSRQVVAALERQIGTTLRSVEVWSLADAAAPPELSPATRFRTARGSRLAYASFGLRSGAAGDALAIVLHAHLLPVTLPLVRCGARVVPVLLGIESWKPLGRLERAALRRAWRVAAISQHTIDRFRAANPDLVSIPVRVCHPGLAESPNAAGASSVRDDSPFALIVGRMASDERYKGHDELLEIWPRVLEHIPAATLVVAGGGDDRARLAARAASLGVAQAVRFEGLVPADRLAQLYRDAAVFVMPSPNEGFGLVFVEAMRAATPCIAARGAAEEIVDHGVTGLIVPAGDRAALASALTDLLANPARRATMGRRAAEVARRRFSAAAFADRLYELLDIADRDVAAVDVRRAAC